MKGVAWDPLGEYFASQSCDRTCKLYRINCGGTKKVKKGSKQSQKNQDDFVSKLAYTLKNAKFEIQSVRILLFFVDVWCSMLKCGDASGCG